MLLCILYRLINAIINANYKILDKLVFCFAYILIYALPFLFAHTRSSGATRRNNNGNQANQVGPQNPAAAQAQVNAGPAAPKAAESQDTEGSQEEPNPNHEHEQP